MIQSETKRNKLLQKNTEILFLFTQTAAHYKTKMQIKLRIYSSAERISKWSKCNTHKSRRLAFEQSIEWIWFWISVSRCELNDIVKSKRMRNYANHQTNGAAFKRMKNAHREQSIGNQRKERRERDTKRKLLIDIFVFIFSSFNHIKVILPSRFRLKLFSSLRSMDVSEFGEIILK